MLFERTSASWLGNVLLMVGTAEVLLAVTQSGDEAILWGKEWVLCDDEETLWDKEVMLWGDTIILLV